MDSSEQRFDTLSYATELEEAGVPAEQARVHARTLGAALARHAVPRHELASLASELRAVVEQAASSLRTDLADRDAKLYEQIGGIKASIEGVKGLIEGIKWMVATLAVSALGVCAYFVTHFPPA